MKTEDCKKLVRLYVPEAQFTAGEECVLSEGQAHYLRNVMRKAPGDHLRVFNGQQGDWLATLEEISKNKAIIKFVNQMSEQKNSPDIWVIASPVKKEPFDLMVQKACELGAAKFIPAVCDHTVVHKINRQRLQAIAVEAAEQSERGDVMTVEPLVHLKDFLKSYDSSRNLMFCLEREGAAPFAETVRQKGMDPVALLIGPEGGFSDSEVSLIKGLNFACSVSLGPRILKAETALIAALGGLQLVRN